MEQQSEYQDLELEGARYRLIVENSGLKGAAWKAFGFVQQPREKFQHAFEAEAPCESEAKQVAHRWAFGASAARPHPDCDGNCSPWQLTYRNAVALWFAAEGIKR
jgi:hypothetical protein